MKERADAARCRLATLPAAEEDPAGRQAALRILREAVRSEE